MSEFANTPWKTRWRIPATGLYAPQLFLLLAGRGPGGPVCRG
jgi:hypothetical protein